MPVTATITNDDAEPATVRVALFPSPTEEAGEMQEEVRELAAGASTEVVLPADRAVRLLLVPVIEG